MSDQLPSPMPTHDSDVVREDSPALNPETLSPTPTDPPPPPPPPENFDPSSHPRPDEEANCPDDEEEVDDDDGGDVHVDPPITAAATSPSGGPITRREVATLTANLNPVPFIPNKILDFAKHEKLLKKLGLWDFVHIDLDRNIRVDMIAQLVATYEPPAGYVDGFRITVSRADLARAFKLSEKKKGNADDEPLSDASVGFVSELVSDWMLLHEDTWIMPKEVKEWFELITNGHPEKVDWASLFWFMVEKELKQGCELKDCHYASHLQHLIKFQRKDLFWNKQLECEHATEDLDEMHERDDIDLNMVGEEINNLGAKMELSLGKEGEKEEGVKEEEREDEQGQWLLNGKNEFGEYLMRCDAENSEAFGSFAEQIEEEEEEDENDDENKFGLFSCHNDSLAGDGFSGNLLPTIEENQMAFNSQVHLRGQSSVDMSVDDMPTFFTNRGKRLLEQHDETHLMHHHERNKKLRISNFGTCMEQIQNVADRARMLYEEKARVLDQTSTNQQIMLSKLQKRDSVIEHLHQIRYEEAQKKDREIYRLERELYVMGSVLEGYRKALKETQRAFVEYRKEEFKMNCFIFEEKMNGIVEDWDGQFSIFSDKVSSLEKKLTGLEADAKELIGLRRNSKNDAN
ncbi:Unknown protein [Striga hermonthica]|uniref:Uncharacterized protein n=1 Tax=Striga hermonthica TaxID=68872 RepID=A0A9N7RE38_STRHE|nr:Unknown protein [Striga hermonthica]